MPSPPARALESLRRESILVTGAGGSIGTALASRLAALRPQELVLLDASESRLLALKEAFAQAGLDPAIYILGSVANRAVLDEIFAHHAPRLIFHAAAFKHVPLLENQPLAAIENNIFGTLNLARSATGRARIVLLSTDKAVEPASVMGATKRVAEQIVLGENGTVLRLVNVLASSGSVAEIFARQIDRGGPVTITEEAAERYFMTIDEAVDCLLAASLESEPALLAPSFCSASRIADLARFMIGELAPGRPIALEITHPRPGDKEAEKLWSSDESPGRSGTDGLLALKSPLLERAGLDSALACLRARLEGRDLSRALEDLRVLVPAYLPGPAALAAAGGCSMRVAS
jgi:FlaA1/EpsC-like NDP-sugar epimerase